MKKAQSLILVLMLLVFSAFSAGAALADEIAALAASLRPPLETIFKDLESNGVVIKGVFDASGNLARQIMAGAPYGLFISADEKWARHAESKLVDVKPFATCPLVLWHPSGKVPSLSILSDGKSRIAIANPDTAPFGSLGQDYLKEIGVYGKLTASKKLVVAGDIMKAGLASWSGGADAALVSLSVAKSLGGSWIEIPGKKQSYYGGLVKGKYGKDLENLWNYLRSPDAAKLLGEAGFKQL